MAPIFVVGLDVSFDVEKITPAWCRDRWAEGYRVLVCDLWSGDRGFSAESALDAWYGLGGIVAGYTAVSAQVSAVTALRESEQSAGDSWHDLAFVAMDNELQGVAASDITKMLVYFPKNAIIYTSQGAWDNIGSQQFAGVPLWNASWDVDPTLDVNYGGWNTAVGHQYKNDVVIDGVKCDISVWDLDWLRSLGVEVEPYVVPELDGIWKALDIVENEASANGDDRLSQLMEDTKQNYVVVLKRKLGLQ